MIKSSFVYICLYIFVYVIDDSSYSSQSFYGGPKCLSLLACFLMEKLTTIYFERETEIHNSPAELVIKLKQQLYIFSIEWGIIILFINICI